MERADLISIHLMHIHFMMVLCYNMDARPKVAIIGYPRCGQHAISHWLFSHSPGLSLFINNFGGSSDKIYYKGGVVTNCIDVGSVDLLGYGLEGAASCKTNRDVFRVYVIRDIRNHVASIEAHPIINHDSLLDYVWEEYLNVKDGVLVKFPQWHDSLEYREKMFYKIVGGLGLDWEFSDVGREEVLGSGGGSSFDRESYNGCASSMDVNSRYKIDEVRDVIGRIPDRLIRLSDEYVWRPECE